MQNPRETREGTKGKDQCENTRTREGASSQGRHAVMGLHIIGKTHEN